MPGGSGARRGLPEAVGSEVRKFNAQLSAVLRADLSDWSFEKLVVASKEMGWLRRQMPTDEEIQRAFPDPGPIQSKAQRRAAQARLNYLTAHINRLQLLRQANDKIRATLLTRLDPNDPRHQELLLEAIEAWDGQHRSTGLAPTEDQE